MSDWYIEKPEIDIRVAGLSSDVFSFGARTIKTSMMNYHEARREWTIEVIVQPGYEFIMEISWGSWGIHQIRTVRANGPHRLLLRVPYNQSPWSWISCTFAFIRDTAVHSA